MLHIETCNPMQNFPSTSSCRSYRKLLIQDLSKIYTVFEHYSEKCIKLLPSVHHVKTLPWMQHFVSEQIAIAFHHREGIGENPVIKPIRYSILSRNALLKVSGSHGVVQITEIFSSEIKGHGFCQIWFRPCSTCFRGLYLLLELYWLAPGLQLPH